VSQPARRGGLSWVSGLRERLPRGALSDRFARRYLIALGLSCLVIVGGLVSVNVSVNRKLSRIQRVKGLSLAKEPGANSGNFLVIGSDSRSFVQNQAQANAFGSQQQTGGQRSDTMMIIHVDPSQKHILAVSLPRDTLVDIQGQGRQKLNAAFNGGPQLLINTVQQNFRVKISHYVEVGFDSFAGIVDAIGHVPVSFPAPAFDPCTGLYVPGAGTVQLDGGTALQYVRARHLLFYRNGAWRDASPRADLDRIGRQQEFIRQLATLAFKKAEKDVFAANDIANSIVGKLKVDEDLAAHHGQILGLVRAFRDVNPSDASGLETLTLPVTPTRDLGALNLKQPEADELLTRLDKFGGPLPLSRNLPPAQVHVRVLNGTGVPGRAANVLAQLTGLQFVGAGVGDGAPTTETEVHYRPQDLPAARTVQTYLGGVGRLIDDPGLSDPVVIVLLGTDFKQAMTPEQLLLGVAAQAAGTSTSTASTTSTTEGAKSPKPPTAPCPQT
jgi:LCP family protein required for cell wall assembly